MTKVWSREEREAAFMAVKERSGIVYLSTDHIYLQCSLTAAEKELAEAKKLLTLAEPGESLSADNMRAWYLERYEFLKRQEGR